jgi:O-antigen biosynthesis protein WbqP
MVLIGPRPILPNQKYYINKRRLYGVYKLKPGMTGWVQVNGRDLTSIDERAMLDKYYLENKSLYLDTKIILLTIKQIFISKGVSH